MDGSRGPATTAKGVVLSQGPARGEPPPCTGESSDGDLTNAKITAPASAGPRRILLEGISVHIKGHTTPQGQPFTVHAKSLGGKLPSGTTKNGLLPHPIAYYDVSIDGISDGTATVSITNDGVQKNKTRIQYWGGANWVDVTAANVTDHTISADIPVRSLHGTPIVVGT